MTRSGWVLKQLRIKNFIMAGKENKGKRSIRGEMGAKKESTYILKQKYANLRYSSRLALGTKEVGVSLFQFSR